MQAQLPKDLTPGGCNGLARSFTIVQDSNISLVIKVCTETKK